MQTRSQVSHPAKIDICKNRFTQKDAVPVTASKITVPEAGIVKGGSVEIRRKKVGFLQNCTGKISSSEASLGEIGLQKISPHEESLGQVSSPKINIGEMHASVAGSNVRSPEIYFYKICRTEFGSSEVESFFPVRLPLLLPPAIPHLHSLLQDCEMFCVGHTSIVERSPT